MYDNQRVMDIVSRVGAMLREPLGGNLSAQLVGLEALRSDLLAVRVDWQQMLAEKKAQYLMPKTKDTNDIDRRVSLNASLANIERDVEFLVGLEALVKERLELGRALL
jgi:hypothetical protein